MGTGRPLTGAFAPPLVVKRSPKLPSAGSMFVMVVFFENNVAGHHFFPTGAE
jgi:hypothetical protein